MEFDTGTDAAASAVMAVLLENHRTFLRFLEGRVGDRAIAEDILQDAFTRVIRRPDLLPAENAVIPWFYRSLRNAATDQFRRRGAADRALASFASELEATEVPAGSTAEAICACVSRLAGTLKPEYADALEAIEIEGMPVKHYAEKRGLSATNAAVRVHRARQALKKRVRESCGTCAEHGCLNCTCGSTR